MAANALTARAMLRIGQKDGARAAEDALAVQRLALLLGQGSSLIDKLVAVAIRSIGSPLPALIAVIPSPGSKGEQRGPWLRSFLRRLTTLPSMPPLVGALDNYGRFWSLDRLLYLRQRAAESGPGCMLDVLEPQAYRGFGQPPVDPLVYALPVAAFDWDEALRLENRGHDLLTAAAQARSEAERRSGGAAYDAHLKSLWNERAALLDSLRKSAGTEAPALANVVAAAEAPGAHSRGAAAWP